MIEPQVFLRHEHARMAKHRLDSSSSPIVSKIPELLVESAGPRSSKDMAAVAFASDIEDGHRMLDDSLRLGDFPGRLERWLSSGRDEPSFPFDSFHRGRALRWAQIPGRIEISASGSIDGQPCGEFGLEFEAYRQPVVLLGLESIDPQFASLQIDVADLQAGDLSCPHEGVDPDGEEGPVP